MNISIIGAGNLGTAIAADLGRKHSVKLYSSKPDKFSKELVFRDMENNIEFTSMVSKVTNSYEEAVSNADMVFIAVPTFLTKPTVEGIMPYLSKNTILGFVPGAGGVEYLARSAIEAGNTVFGFERVPYVARVEEYGRIVSASKKAHYRVASIPSSQAGRISHLIEELFNVPCTPMLEFISITLTPSLHCARLYDLYRNYKQGEELEDNPFFYGEWRDSASYITFNLDYELHQVCDALTSNGISASEVVPYPVHYESATPELLTKKLRSIQSLSRIKGPLLQTATGRFILDIDSRYFTESYPYRLSIVKGLADIVELEVPKTDEVLQWYSRLACKEYYNNNIFMGKDVIECNIPQNYGIHTIEALRDFYK